MDNHLARFDKKRVYTFIDYETYSLCLNFIHNKPWQVGLLKVVGDETVESQDILVKWPKPPLFRQEMVSQLFHCSVAELNARIAQKGVTPEEAFTRVYDALENCDNIVGHNILGFDNWLTKEWCKLNNK